MLTAVAGSTVLVAVGLIGSPQRDERFESKQVVVTPAGGDGLRIREVVDVDFGSDERRGYQRLIPNDFGAPVDVVASSPDAPDDVSVVPEGDFTRIRVGDPAVTNTGQHRYVLTYTLPDAQVSTGELALDIIGTDETLATEQLRDRRRRTRPRGPALQRRLVRPIRRMRPRVGCRRHVPRRDRGPRARSKGITIGGRITDVTTPPVVARTGAPAPHLRQSNPARRSPWCRSGWRLAVPSTSGRVAEAATRCSPAVQPTPRTAHRHQ